jgi:hypothetical protein
MIIVDCLIDSLADLFTNSFHHLLTDAVVHVLHWVADGFWDVQEILS